MKFLIMKYKLLLLFALIFSYSVSAIPATSITPIIAPIIAQIILLIASAFLFFKSFFKNNKKFVFFGFTFLVIAIIINLLRQFLII